MLENLILIIIKNGRDINRKFYLIFFCFMMFTSQVFCQNLNDISFGNDSNFDIVTWNIEWFPKRGATTVDSVSKIIESLNVDLIGLQEIDDSTLCRQMIDNIPGYELFMDDDWFGGLAYVYKTSSINVQSIYKIYDTAPYWNVFPRSPLVIELVYMGEKLIVINNHFKCCGDGILDMGNSSDEEFRRYEASRLLKQYIDSNFTFDRVILIGDLNDETTDMSPNNVFQVFLNDSNNYLFADDNIANGATTYWSFPSWPSHIDHILITNELFLEFSSSGSGVQTIRVDDFMSGGLADYDYYISDHRPVGMKVNIIPTTFSLVENSRAKIKVFPNPTENYSYIDLSQFKGEVQVTISDLNGKVFNSMQYKGNQLVEFNFDGKEGMYLISAKSNNDTSVLKWIKK